MGYEAQLQLRRRSLALPETTPSTGFFKKISRFNLFVIVRELLFGIIWFE
jgi:hypothetical protein